jgi:hypothetical protein
MHRHARNYHRIKGEKCQKIGKGYAEALGIPTGWVRL